MTEVVCCSSALTQADGPMLNWLSRGVSRNFFLGLPDGSSLSLEIGVKDISALHQNSSFSIATWLNRKMIEENGFKGSTNRKVIADNLDPCRFPFTMQCMPPRPRYKSPSEEPNDNSPSMRATRLAVAQLDLFKLSPKDSPEQVLTSVWIQLYILTTIFPSEEAFNISLPSSAPHYHSIRDLTVLSGMALPHPSQSDSSSYQSSLHLLFSRATFWQSAYPFLRPPWIRPDVVNGPLSTSLPLHTSYTFTNHTHHPVRPSKSPHAGPLYRRFSIELNETLTFEVASSTDDELVKLLTKWHDSDRVCKGWRQRGSFEMQKKHLEDIESSTDQMGLVGKWNGVPWGYVEIYFAKESNIGPYFTPGDWDRGFHALVGEETFRGPHRVRTWMGSVIHMLFLLDARTQQVVLEPRASNTKMVNYACMCGGHVEKVMDLPHKRAALVVILRERFFQLCPLGPQNM